MCSAHRFCFLSFFVFVKAENCFSSASRSLPRAIGGVNGGVRRGRGRGGRGGPSCLRFALPGSIKLPIFPSPHSAGGEGEAQHSSLTACRLPQESFQIIES